MSPRQITRAYGHHAACLKLMEHLKGFSQFFEGFDIVATQLFAYYAARLFAYHVVA